MPSVANDLGIDTFFDRGTDRARRTVKHGRHGVKGMCQAVSTRLYSLYCLLVGAVSVTQRHLSISIFYEFYTTVDLGCNGYFQHVFEPLKYINIRLLYISLILSTLALW